VSFEYHEPRSLDGALELLETHGSDAMLVSGGIAFTLMARVGLIDPKHVIALRSIPEIHSIHETADGIWIGAHATHRAVSESQIVQTLHPVISAAFGAIGTIRIRAQGTIGGNLAYADPAQDPPPALTVSSATVHIVGPSGRRRDVPIERFFLDYYTADIEPDEIIIGLSVPAPTQPTVSTYRRFNPRTVDDFPTVSVAAAARLQPGTGTVEDIKIALGGVGPTPLRARSVEEAFVGIVPTFDAIETVSALVADDIAPFDDARGSASFKHAIAVVWVGRALRDLTAIQSS